MTQPKDRRRGTEIIAWMELLHLIIFYTGRTIASKQKDILALVLVLLLIPHLVIARFLSLHSRIVALAFLHFPTLPGVFHLRNILVEAMIPLAHLLSGTFQFDLVFLDERLHICQVEGPCDSLAPIRFGLAGHCEP